MSENNFQGEILAVCASEKKHTPKKNVGEGVLRVSWGLVKDAHAGEEIKQVSLLAQESIEKAKKSGLNVGFGDFGENLTTRGIDLVSLPIGQKLKVGEDILLEVSQIGKQCLKPCAIFYKTGDCIMPKEGIFAKVLKGGKVKAGDTVEVIR
ncbi:MAG: MOSC domain-containing protein [Candidatus Omnitrophica bacterium]|nr:MOSC domain-containing protein [Candidatus Omnitrophota bacterium]